MKTRLETATKPHPKLVESRPAGMWRMRVRGLRRSISASMSRLNAMAADRAPTMATTIQAVLIHSRRRSRPPSRMASTAPVSANGSAKTECSNLIISSVSRTRFQNISAAQARPVRFSVSIGFARAARPVPRRAAMGRKKLPFYRMRSARFALVGLLVYFGCGPQTEPVEDLNTRIVTLPGGREIRAEVMLKPAEMARGMMYRDALPQGRGMLFIHEKPAPYRYWMSNVKDPLDIIFMDENRQIVEISA